MKIAICPTNDLLIRPNESFICSNDSFFRSNDLVIRPNGSSIVINVLKSYGNGDNVKFLLEYST